MGFRGWGIKGISGPGVVAMSGLGWLVGGVGVSVLAGVVGRA